jgi:hypothetical protein
MLARDNRIHALWGEIARYPADRADEANRHLMRALSGWIGATHAGWAGTVRVLDGPAAESDPLYAIVNNGEILANVSGQTLDVNAGNGGVTNNNMLEAENGGTLTLHNTITNTNGHIDATGGGTVNVNATIVGGLLFAANGGVMQTDSAATLNGVEIRPNSVYLAGAGTASTLIGTINNEGSLHVAAGAAGDALVSLGSDVTLSGGGSVVLSNGGAIPLRSTGPPAAIN